MLAAIGLNHHKAPIALRERFALSKIELQKALHRLRGEGIKELAILSTCNRTEIYCHAHKDLSPIMEWLAQAGKVSAERLESHVFIAPSHEAVRHIYRVASGLDSMVVGEPQILGQIKAAVRLAHDNATLGSTLHRLFQSAFAVAKQVRSGTEIGRHGVSMATVAVQLAETIFGDLASSSILFIGTGEMINLSATHFCARRPTNIMFVSRDLGRAETLCERFGGHAGLMGDIEEHLHRFDMVISCTETTLPILGAGMIHRALKKRGHRPMMIVDLGVPRNVEPEAARENDLFLYSVDDLQKTIENNLGKRHDASQKAELIIESHVESFMRYLEERRAVHVIQQLHEHSHHIAEQEINKALRKIDNGEDAAAVLRRFSQSLTAKTLHPWLAKIHAVEGQHFDTVLKIYQSVLDQTKQSRHRQED